MFSWIKDLFKPAAELIDDLHLSGEESKKLKNELAKIQAEANTKFIELEKSLLEANTKRIQAESSSDSFIVRSWRPLTSTALVTAIILSAYGIGNPGPELYDLAKIILGGYVGGRSLEKAIKVSKLGK